METLAMQEKSGNYDALLRIIKEWEKTRLTLYGKQLLEAQSKFLAEVKKLQPPEKTHPLTPADVLAQLRADALLIKRWTHRATSHNPGRAVNQRVARDDVVPLWRRGYDFADAHGLQQPPNEPTEPYSAPELCNAVARFVDWCDGLLSQLTDEPRAEPSGHADTREDTRKKVVANRRQREAVQQHHDLVKFIRAERRQKTAGTRSLQAIAEDFVCERHRLLHDSDEIRRKAQTLLKTIQVNHLLDTKRTRKPTALLKS